MAISWNREDPLSRAPRETRKANDALGDYWRMGPGRSLAKLVRTYREGGADLPPTRHLSIIEGWSTRYAWQARVDRAKALQDKATEQLWLERQLQIREAAWLAGQELRQKVEQYLAVFQNFVRRTEGDVEDPETGERIKLVTVELAPSLSQITGALDTAVRLQREAAGVPLPEQPVNLRGGSVHIYIPDNGRQTMPVDDQDDQEAAP